MFTQCPDCQTTFRVTAEVLQQAEGRVRCGGCGNAFNALEHLSKDDSSQANANTSAPQQTSASDESPTARNKALLETLDKLAGPEVRIEDTGVEWRVLDDEPFETGAETETGETSSLRFVLEDDSNEATPEEAVLLGRQDDLPQAGPATQESLDLPEREDARPPTSRVERRYGDDTILPDDFGQEDDLDELPFLTKPIVPKRRAADREAVQDSSAFDEAQVDLALGEPDDWVDLLDEVYDEDQPAPDDDESDAAAESEVALEASADEEASPTDLVGPDGDDEEPADDADEFPEEDMPSDIDTQFLQQAEELGLDTGNYEIAAVAEEDEGEEEIVAEDQEPEVDELAETDIHELVSDEEEQEDEAEEAEIAEELDLVEEDAEAELESTGDFEAQIVIAEKALAGEDEDGDEDSEKPVELELEEELAASGTEDDIAPEEPADITAATMIGGHDVSRFFDEDSPMVETIVMEGDSVNEALQDALQQERRKTAGTNREFENPGPLDDTYSLNRGKIRGGRRASDPASYTVMASVVVLGLILLGQVIHQSRQSLATFGAFNHTIGSVYRVLGKAITPEWDIKGWQFEATNGSVDETEELLTIYSRIANKSSQSLPYPLVHVSLTDRWVETIGSRVLEPNDYLAGDLDPRKPVPPGENFTAVITIESPSEEATGFKLNVCYRVAPGRVRCATQDFKD